MQYGIIHTPLMATVRANKRNPDRRVAFLGNQLCFFEHGALIPAVDTLVEVMITRVLLTRYPEGHEKEGRWNYTKLASVMIEVVDHERHMLVAINGFETAGTMCRTTADGVITDGTRVYTSEDVWSTNKTNRPTFMSLTPGRTDIIDASNVNVRVDRSDARPRTPTNVWVEKAQYEEKHGHCVRVQGLTRKEDHQWAKLIH